MFVILILCTMAVIIGLAHIAQIVWTKSNKERLAMKYKPGTEAHRINSANLNPRRLPVATVCTLLAIAALIVIVQKMVQIGGSVESLIVPGIIVGMIMALFTLTMAFNHYTKK